MFSWVQLGHVANWSKAKCAGSFSAGIPVPAISTDTRSLRAGEVFVALRGDHFDGHDHVRQAAEKGAVAVIAERETGVPIPHFIVENSLRALATVGARLRDRFTGTVVGITGSAGKSSTKEMVAVLLGEHTVKSPASFNNLLGVSKTLTLVEDTTRFLVLEMGMNALGEIRELCEHFRPQAGVITNIGDAHVGKLGGQSKVLQAKKELFDFLASQESTLGIALNKADARVMQAYTLAFSKEVPRVTYAAAGNDTLADFRVVAVSIDPHTAKLRLGLDYKGETCEIALGLFGRHHAENLAASVSVALLLGVSFEQIRARLELIRPAVHRGEISPLGKGVLIDESYNSNPTALRSSLESLAHLDPKRRKIIVLGDMLELGEFEQEYHRKAGEAVSALRSQHSLVFVAVGDRMRWAADVVCDAGPEVAVHRLKGVDEAIRLLPSILNADDVVLIKGSRGGKLDLLVDALQRNAAR